MSEMSLEPEEVMQLLAVTLQSRKDFLRRPVSISFGVVDAGKGFILDTARSPMIRGGVTTKADISVVCNRRALSDFVLGRLNPKKPQAEQLFVWGGDDAPMRALAGVLQGGSSLLQAHLSSLEEPK